VLDIGGKKSAGMTGLRKKLITRNEEPIKSRVTREKEAK
jgi:hypothetical protein